MSSVEAELVVVARTATSSRYAAQLSPGGVRTWLDEPLGAAYLGCGGILTEHGAIMRGVGASHV
jgi:hypothetical protein